MSEKEHIATDEARFVRSEHALDELNEAITALIQQGIYEGVANGLQVIIDARAAAPELSTRQQRQLLHARVLERFNRAHGQNSKIRLEDICAEMGDSYEAVRRYRSRKGKGKNHK